MLKFDSFSSNAVSQPPVDAWRDGDAYVVELDVPGVDAGAIDVNVEQNLLTVRAERPEPTDIRNWLIAERAHGVFSRQLSLSRSVDTNGITADYVDGVLRLAIPVAEPAKPRKVAVVPGNQQAVSA